MFLVGALAGCGGSNSSNSPSTPPVNTQDFLVQGTNVVSGSVWKLNRPIDITFSQPVDISTVNANTIQISDSTGIPALGEYSLITPTVVRFQPLCPSNATFTNGGLQQNRIYFLVVVGSNASAVTVRNTAGEPVETGLSVTFRTPVSGDPLELFVDSAAGPPALLIHSPSETRPEEQNPPAAPTKSYVEFGDGTVASLKLTNGLGIIVRDVPLNLYSRVEDQFSVVLRFNQPINSSPTNVSSNRIRFEFETGLNNNVWQAMPTQVELIDNCTASGSSVRVAPEGIVPQGTRLRVNIRDGFEDITGDAIQSDLVSFVRLDSTTVDTAGNPLNGADELRDDFSTNDGEDLTAVSTKPRATWGNGLIEPSFNFDGTGGPGGNFNWVIGPGETIIVDTAADEIRSELGVFQTVINGVIDVNNLDVQGELLFIGPNTVSILAKGTVTVHPGGLISVNGGDNPGVKTLNTTNQPEPGASGNAGGGAGGTGSYLTSQSTPRGGQGEGAFKRAGFGGFGGETSYSLGGLDRRRGAGGGGGRLGASTRYLSPSMNFVICQTLIGFDPEPGFPGGPNGTGAVSQTTRAAGGAWAPLPFLDQFDDNNFFGVMRTAPVLGGGGQVLEPSRLIIGELTKVWAGSGGGAGGDAVAANTFPVTPFNPGGDEKASGGGGGAGGIQILALGEIRILGTAGNQGAIRAEGGYGGAGENTIYFDRIGGGGGGGSGGHIVLSSAQRIFITSEVAIGTANEQAQAFYTDNPTNIRHPMRPISALGGQGGAGKDNQCGANELGQKDWKVDAIPIEAFEGFTDIPPLGNTPGNTTFLNCNVGNPADPEGTVAGGGGDGGPGIIQMHATDMDTQIVFANRPGSYATGVDVTFSCAPPPLGWSRPTLVPNQMIPFFGAESEAISKWISLGQARRNDPSLGLPATNQVLFQFEGTDLTAPNMVDQGVVLRNGTEVAELAPAIDYQTIAPGQTSVPFVTGGNMVTLDATNLDAVYENNPALVRSFTLRLRRVTAPNEVLEFSVVDATYDSVNDTLTVMISDTQGSLVDRILSYSTSGGGEIGLIPNYFQIVSGGVPDLYPIGTGVRITFDATVIDPLTGLPDEDASYSLTQNASNFTHDITDLNAANWDFVRYRIEFDLGDVTQNLSAPKPALDFFRIPFRF